MSGAPVNLPVLGERVLSTLNADGSRRWLRPAVSRGRFLTARRWTAWALIVIFLILPFVTINGRPAIFLNIASREFSLFGGTFFPTDTVLLALLLVGVAVAIFLVTALYGRIWCGWGCPQTVYLEFVFRPIERLFDGVPTRRGEPSRSANGFRTAAKCATFVAISFLLANLFLAYFVGVEELSRWMQRSPLEHPGSFLVMAVTTALMLFDFAYFREQTCILACPYGRLQSVLFDRKTRIVAYDAKRGEPRGKVRSQKSEVRSKNDAAHGGGVAVRRASESDPTSDFLPQTSDFACCGDCVDCGMCVVTCPTGIDIRNGLQLECVGCAQCIDACDAVMDKIHRPRGLIRYGSQVEMEGAPGATYVRRTRVIAYYVILAVVASAFVLTLVTKKPADVTLTRGLGMPFVELSTGEISNALVIKITNRENRSVSYGLETVGLPGARLELEENPLVVEPRHSRTVRAVLVVPRNTFVEGVADATIRVSDAPRYTQDLKYRLLGPMNAANPRGKE